MQSPTVSLATQLIRRVVVPTLHVSKSQMERFQMNSLDVSIYIPSGVNALGTSEGS